MKKKKYTVNDISVSSNNMSRRKSKSIVDMPTTPLLDPPEGDPFDDNPVGATEEADNDNDNVPPPTPRIIDPLDEAEGRRKKRFACAGKFLKRCTSWIC